MVELWMSTAKAVRSKDGGIGSAHYADRVFLVVERRGKELLAWKCDLVKGGLSHPAFKKKLKWNELDRGAILKGRNGSEPTALFKPDSHYRRVTIEELRS